MDNKFCTSCGRNIEKGDKFCSKCGTKIENDENQNYVPKTGLSGTISSKPNKKKVNGGNVFKKIAIIVAIIILFFVGREVYYTSKYMSDEQILSCIRAEDQVFEPLDYEITEYEILDRESNMKAGTDTMKLKVKAASDVLLYNATYDLGFEYKKNKSEWVVKKYEPDNNERRIIPLKYNYDGAWGSIYDGIIELDIDWERGKLVNNIGSRAPKNMVFYDDVVNGYYVYGMMVEGGDIKFEINNYDIMEAARSTNLEMPSRILLVSKDDRRYDKISERLQNPQYYGEWENCLTIRSKDGGIIADTGDIRLLGATSVPPDMSCKCSIQVDFNYGLEYIFEPYLNQEVDIYFFEEKIGEEVIEDISLFYTCMIGESEYVDDKKIDEIYNTLFFCLNYYYK